ncbi:MAG: hypothetical protein M1827_004871 [Pycnora praestabilis]|nr:MAG: hypothetical protein M1827_004871 [Pycnora praestabilis]
MRAPLTDLSDFPYIRETTEDLIATCVSNGIGGSANVGRFGHLQLDIYEGNAIEDESDWAAPELAWEPGQPDTVQPMSVDASAENSKSGCGVMACLRSATCCFGQQCTFNIVASTTLFKLAYGSDKTLREGRYGWCSTITEL